MLRLPIPGILFVNDTPFTLFGVKLDKVVSSWRILGEIARVLSNRSISFAYDVAWVVFWRNNTPLIDLGISLKESIKRYSCITGWDITNVVIRLGMFVSLRTDPFPSILFLDWGLTIGPYLFSVHIWLPSVLDISDIWN